MLLLLVILCLLPFQMDAVAQQEFTGNVLNRGERWTPSNNPFMKMFKYIDTNDDDVVTQQESDVFFNNFDENGDGILTLDEFKEGYTKNVGQSGTVAEFLFHSYDSDNDGVMTGDDQLYLDMINNGGVSVEEYREYLVLKGAVKDAIAAFIFAQGKNDQKRGERGISSNNPFKGVFQYIDTDNDGVVTQQESDVFFDEFDKNGNGLMSLDEFVEGYTENIGQNEDLARFLFHAYDSDNDDFLTGDDQLYLDMINNGGVSKNEYRKYLIFEAAAMMASDAVPIFRGVSLNDMMADSLED